MLFIAVKIIVIAGAGSHTGKTTITCGLLAALKNRGFKICAYKTGPDYIDTEYLRRAGNCEAYNLDTWLMNKAQTRELFLRTSHGKDFAIIEGAMGLFDGGEHSTAEIAKLLNAPVILVINAASVGESAAAVALGFLEFDEDVKISGVILNNIASENHKKIIAGQLERKNIKLFGALPRDNSLKISERHLGLISAFENESLNSENLCRLVEENISVDEIIKISEGFSQNLPAQEKIIMPSKKIVAVARDEAFTFYYPESLGVLENLGAKIIFFSPIHDKNLPEADGYIFGGGFPEMFAEKLSENISMLESVRSCEKKIWAECGGFMYLCKGLKNFHGENFSLAGVIPANAIMTERPIIGYMEARALRKNILCGAGESVRGHEFHYSRIIPEYDEKFFAWELTRKNFGASHFGGFAYENILASYLHVNLFGNKKLAENFLS